MPSSQRGDVWLVDLGLAAKVRPCLVLSIPAKDEDGALVTVLAHTTRPRGSMFEVEIKAKFLRMGVFDAQNMVTIPHAKLVRKLGVLPESQLASIEEVERARRGRIFTIDKYVIDTDFIPSLSIYKL